MAKRSSVKMTNYGEYEEWDRSSKELPSFKHFATEFAVDPACEFGYILHIKGAKRKKLSFEMWHPHPIHTADGESMPNPFTGELIVPQNEYKFFLGDTFWEPLAEKVGEWTLKTFIDGECVATKKFTMKFGSSDDCD